MDGVAEPHSTDDVGPLLVRNTPVVIGQAGPGKSNEFFEGLIDEVKIYTKALSQPEIARECGCQITQPPLPPPPNYRSNGLEAQFSFDALTPADTSGHGYDGVWEGCKRPLLFVQKPQPC